MDGIILIDKPAGPTSAEVVRRLKARVKPERVGHLGTLDPFATGLLPLLIGEGTKLAQFLEGGIKEYRGVISLGQETDTLDPTGEVLRAARIPRLEAGALAELARRFVGWIQQVPPVFSAIKRDGVPLYKLARKGAEVEPPAPRRVFIEALELTPAGPGEIEFTVRCSAGTYIRALARDVACALDSAGHLAQLRRTRSAEFSIDDAQPLIPVLKALELGEPVPILGLREALSRMEEVEVDDYLERRLRNGDATALITCLRRRVAAPVKVVCHEALVAVAALGERGPQILRVFTPSALRPDVA